MRWLRWVQRDAFIKGSPDPGQWAAHCRCSWRRSSSPCAVTGADDPDLFPLIFSNASGIHRTLSTAGPIDTGNPFFQDLGTNGRTCFTCHRPEQAWTVTPPELRERFRLTRGLDPIFRTNDGSNCEGADVSSIGARRAAFSLLLSKGLIRVELGRSRPTPSSRSSTWTIHTDAERHSLRRRSTAGRCPRRTCRF